MPSLKIKGGGGLRIGSNNNLEFYSPCPETSYSGPIGHISLRKDLKFKAIDSKPKSLNCLSAIGAEMEYRAQARLSMYNIGFDSWCWGQFNDEQEPEVDVHGFQTGFCICEHDADFAPANRVLGYFKYQAGAQRRKIHDNLNGDQLDFHYHMTKRMGNVKRVMSQDARLGRHSSTQGNFLFNPRTDTLIATDTDTVVDYNEMDNLERGSQFVRDGVSDIMKRLSELQFAGDIVAISKIAEQTITHFLEGLFGDTVEKNKIMTAVKSLCIKKRIPSDMPYDTSGWVYFGSMLPEIYEMFYALFLESSLVEIFPVQRIDPRVLRKRAHQYCMENRTT